MGLAFLPSQVGAILLGSIGVLGLLLAAIGLYGVMDYSVVRRTREIGIRISVGATRSDVSRMVLVECARLVVTGSAIGLFIALFLTKSLAIFLVPGLRNVDPITFLAVIFVTILTGMFAAWGPVRRSIRKQLCDTSNFGNPNKYLCLKSDGFSPNVALNFHRVATFGL